MNTEASKTIEIGISEKSLEEEIMTTTVGAILGAVTTIVTTITEVGTDIKPTSLTSTEARAVIIPWGISEEIRDKLYVCAGWQLAIALITIIFAVVIGIYGPYVFGSQALLKGMGVATEILEFFLPVKYAGRSVEEKMDGYTHEQYVSKIRRFGGFIAFTMTAFALFEMITGAVGRAALHEHAENGGSMMLLDIHVTLCVISGILSFGLLFSSIQLFRKRFLPEMMLVYSMRNALMCVLFTLNWMRALGVDTQISDGVDAMGDKFDAMKNKVVNATSMINN